MAAKCSLATLQAQWTLQKWSARPVGTEDRAQGSAKSYRRPGAFLEGSPVKIPPFCYHDVKFKL